MPDLPLDLGQGEPQAAPTAFGELATALREIAAWERHRIALTTWLAVRGHCDYPGGIELGGWKQRARRIDEAAQLLERLVPHEAAVRLINPAPLLASSAAASAPDK